MNEVLLANLFFIITGSAILVVAALIAVALYQLVGALRTLRSILERMDRATDHFVEDAKALRDHVVSGAAVARAFGAVMNAVSGVRPKRRSTRKKKTETEDEEAES